MATKRLTNVLSLLVCAAAAVVTVESQARTLRVASDGTEPYESIQAAIDDSRSGDDVSVGPGVYEITTPVDFGGRRITVASTDGAAATTIRMLRVESELERAAVVLFDSNEVLASRLEGFTLEGGFVAESACFGGMPCVQERDGGGIVCVNASPTVVGCTVRGNVGGGVVVRGTSQPRFEECLVSGNLCIGYGGAIAIDNGGAPSFDHCTVAYNTVDRAGIAIHGGSLTMSSSILWGHESGSIWFAEGIAREASVTFSCVEQEDVLSGEGNINQSPDFCGWGEREEVFVDAGALSPGDGTAGSPYRDLALALSFGFGLAGGSPCSGAGHDGSDMGASFQGCAAAGVQRRAVRLAEGEYDAERHSFGPRVRLIGDALRAELTGTVHGLGSDGSVAGVTIARGAFGGIRLGAGESPLIEDCALVGNDVAGVRCASGASPRILRSVFATGRGAGILCDASSALIVEGCDIVQNAEGGIRCGPFSTPSISGCHIAHNRGFLILHHFIGGGVQFAHGTDATIEATTIEGNLGDGVLLEFDVRATITNSEILGTTGSELFICCSGGYPLGSGVTVFGGGALTLFNSTVAHNTGRGITGFGSDLTVTNSIVWGNGVQSIDAQEKDTNVSFSIVENERPWPGTGNLRDDPQFVLAGSHDDRGTPEVTEDDIWTPGDYRLAATSPAVGAGTLEGAPEVDIDGNSRACDDAVDLGARERGACEPTESFLRGDINSDGSRDISDAVFGFLALFGGGAQPRCLDGADVNDSGVLDISDPIALLNWLFRGLDPLPPPAEACGVDPTADELDCAAGC